MVHYEPLVHCHVSGHGSREELKLMLGLVKPRHFIPVHGEYRMLVQHGLLAEGAGVDVDKIFVLENGQVVEFDGTRARHGRLGFRRRGAGRRHRGHRRDRRGHPPRPADARLGRGGDGRADPRRQHRSAGRRRPDIVSRGFLSDPDDPFMQPARDHLLEASASAARTSTRPRPAIVKTKIRDTLSRFFHERTKRRPMILPIVMEV